MAYLLHTVKIAVGSQKIPKDTQLPFPYKKAANQEVFFQIEDDRIKLVSPIYGYVNVKTKLWPHPL